MSLIHEIVAKEFPKILTNLSKCLDKGAVFAEQKKFDPEVLWNARLAPDQFNLIKQIQIACDTTVRAAAKLANKELPSFPDTEKTLPELKGRLEKAAAFARAFTAQDFDGAESRKITLPRWEGKTLTGLEFLTQYSIPNVFFHVTTAYSILRHNGVDVGKTDYLGELPFKN